MSSSFFGRFTPYTQIAEENIPIPDSASVYLRVSVGKSIDAHAKTKVMTAQLPNTSPCLGDLIEAIDARSYI
jgi:hypothetical protein